MGSIFKNPKLALILFFTVISSSSCLKFEDGPYLSLLSSKQRLSREWKVEYSINLESGIIHSADFAGWTLVFDKGGSFTNTILYNQVKTSYYGKWEIIGQNQLRLSYTIESVDITEFYTIYRLSKKELWINDGKEEIHYYSD